MIRKFIIALTAFGAIAGVGIGMAQTAVAVPYPNCKAAAQDGRYDIPSDDPAYGPHLDRDNDGIGCES